MQLVVTWTIFAVVFLVCPISFFTQDTVGQIFCYHHIVKYVFAVSVTNKLRQFIESYDLFLL